MVSPRPAWLFLDHLSGTVDLAAARSVLREIITLGDQAPGLTDEQLRFRLLTLAAHTAPKSPAHRSSIGRWSAIPPNRLPAADRPRPRLSNSPISRGLSQPPTTRPGYTPEGVAGHGVVGA